MPLSSTMECKAFCCVRCRPPACLVYAKSNGNALLFIIIVVVCILLVLLLLNYFKLYITPNRGELTPLCLVLFFRKGPRSINPPFPLLDDNFFRIYLKSLQNVQNDYTKKNLKYFSDSKIPCLLLYLLNLINVLV